ncbi:hypothetical protein PT974_04674 [Cladobotryum mycophilum]|uniref:Transcriptional regulator n=1 Tax=Cladobotryum mycophilum TaxID=491253 RepID=A0ABR0SWG7_9HYPO
MYLRDVHAETTIATLRQLIRDNPLGILTTAIRSERHPLIQSSHIPFILDVANESDETELGVLRGHVARQNPQSKAMIESVQSSASSSDYVLEEEVLVLFNSPVHHYVTPKFYTETKPSNGKVVPTWNYAAAQVYGKAKIYFDSKSEETVAFLSKQVDDLSRHSETSIMGYTGSGSKPTPWNVSDAPDKYVQLLQKAIIGIEIKIDRFEGKFKMSQEMSQGDREGVINGFGGMGSEIGSQMAEIVRERGHLHEQAKK